MNDLLTKSSFDLARDRRLLFLADFLPPEFGAVGQYMLLRARALAERGHDVELIGLTSGAPSIKRQALGSGRLTEIRLLARPVPRGNLASRLVWTIWTNLRLLLRAFRSLRHADVTLFTGAPPFLIHVLVPLKPLWKGRLIYRITDFYPECLAAAQDGPSFGLRMLQALTDFWRRRIDQFEVLGEDQRRRLLERGLSTERILLVRDVSPVVFAAGQASQSLPTDLSGSCVLLYSGNCGIAHEVETVARGYQLHHRRGSGRVRLWLNASGQGAASLSSRLLAEGLPISYSSPVPLEELASLLVTPDAHLVTLKDAFVGFVMPSKIYACLQSGKPLIFIGSRASDVDLLAQRRAGSRYWRIECGDAEGFADALEDLADQTSASRTVA